MCAPPLPSHRLKVLLILHQHCQVVEAPGDSVLIPDGAALSVFQYFENVRNFLVAMEEMGLPTFEASDLEQVVIYY